MLLAALRRQWIVIAASIFVFVLAGLVYVSNATPKYLSAATILIDPGNQKLMDQMSETTGTMADESFVLGQVELAKSDKVAKAVASMMDLKHNAIFMDDRPSIVFLLIGSVRDLLLGGSGPVDNSPALVERRIIETLQRNLKVERVGRTSALLISYSSPNAQLSSSITQSFADAYLAEQLNAKFEATRSAGEWLQQRIDLLGVKASQSDLAVQDFKNSNQLISTNGQLVSDQQLGQISARLIDAQSELSSSKAKVESITEAIKTGEVDSVVSASISSPVVSNLQEKYLETSRRETEVGRRVGVDHNQAVKLREQMAEYRRLMFEELSRIAQGYESDYKVASGKVDNLQKQLRDATQLSSTANGAQVELRRLQREADTYRNLHRTFLQKYQESLQQESFPVTEARIITEPFPAMRPSSPKKGLSLALAGLLGIAVGGGLGALREWRDRFFRTGEQISSNLNLNFLGYVPEAEADTVTRRSWLDGSKDPRKIFKRDTIANYVVENPLSTFAEAIRNAKMAIELAAGGKRPIVVGVVSIFPGEGKSTFAINLGELIANQGSHALLIDCDLRNPGATSVLGQHAERGLLEALMGVAPLEDLTMANSATALRFLPVIAKQPVANSAELLASASMDRMLREASEKYEYVIVDLPPCAPLVDAKAVSSKIDCFILVVEWGKTPRNMVKKHLSLNGPVADKCVGVILNKVKVAQLRLYEGFGSRAYDSKSYRSYFRERR
jgi:succinoglycan biosynthesis transport protein ExoP